MSRPGEIVVGNGYDDSSSMKWKVSRHFACESESTDISAQDVAFKLSRLEDGTLTLGARVEIRNIKGKRTTSDL